MKDRGIIVKSSDQSVKETINKLQAVIESNGATMYARIDQQAELKKAGISIPPLEFILFGNPAAGGKLIQANSLVSLDLPLKIISWEDEKQKVWLAYNDAEYIQTRYGLNPDVSAILDLNKLIQKALG